MIAWSATLGVGLFLQAGRVIYLAGPGMAVICYLLAGSVMWSMMACPSIFRSAVIPLDETSRKESNASWHSPDVPTPTYSLLQLSILDFG